MIRTGHWSSDSPKRKKTVTDGGVELFKTTIVSSPEGERPSPNAYLVEQAADVAIRSHYHIGSQFQVVVKGGGWLGRREIQPFIVQYVSPHTGYGPIVAGAGGLAYLTMRPVTVPGAGAQYLPDRRDALDMARPKRQVMSEPAPAIEGGAATHAQTTMIEPQADGLAAWMVHLPAGGSASAPLHAGGGGRYYVVAAGTLETGNESLGELGIVWATDSDAAFELKAGALGLSVLAMQFPAGAW